MLASHLERFVEWQEGGGRGGGGAVMGEMIYIPVDSCRENS